MDATTRPADAGLGWPFCVPCSCPFAFATDPSCASLMGSVLGLEAGTDDRPLSWEDLELLPARGLPGWVPCLCEAVREGSLEEAASELGSGGGDRCSRGEREPTGLCSRSLAGRRASEERRRPKGPGGPHLGSSVSSKSSLQLLRDLGPLLCLSVPWFPHLQSRRGDLPRRRRRARIQVIIAAKRSGRCRMLASAPAPRESQWLSFRHRRYSSRGTDGSAAWSKSNVVYRRGHAAR